MKRMLALWLGLALCAPACSYATAETLTVSRVKALLVDLGYEPTVSNDVVTVEGLGSSKSDVKFVVNDDKTSVNVYSNWSIPADKQNAIPSLDMLKANSSSPFAFALYGKDGDLTLDLEASYDASLVGKKMMRKTIDQLLETISSNEAMWDTDKWAPAKPVDGGRAVKATPAAATSDKSYEAAQADADAAWEKAPLTVGKLYFLKEKAAEFGVYTKRTNADFKHGDVAYIYMEPVSYKWGTQQDGMYKFGFSMDLNLKIKKGDVDVDVPDFLKLPMTNRYKLKNLYANIDLTLKDTLPVGDYVLKLTVHDLNTGATASSEMPLTISKS